ncbi:MAG TPA: hypothetical protein VF809_03305 [Candidatus Saccharimonadales bacterium]
MTLTPGGIPERYIGGLELGLELPIGVGELPACTEGEINDATIRAAVDVSRLLHREGITNIVLGSISTQRHLGRAYSGRSLHDVDFAIPQAQIEPAKQALRDELFSTWSEREILATVRNSGGGFGRVHNDGAASDRHINLATGLPIWFGLFGYEEGPAGTLFHEYYTVTRAKVESAAGWLATQDISPGTRSLLESVTPIPHDISVFEVLERAFAEEDQSLWQKLFEPGINSQDMERRRKMAADQPDELFEVKMTRQYPVSANNYFRTQQVETNDTELPVFSLEGGYMFMGGHYPHYLGRRNKYTTICSMIEQSGLLDGSAVDTYKRIFAERKTSHAPVRALDFTLDKIQDPETLRRQPSVASCGRGQVFYPALLFEDIHFKNGE